MHGVQGCGGPIQYALELAQCDVQNETYNVKPKTKNTHDENQQTRNKSWRYDLQRHKNVEEK